jgi:hypothetical protein
MAAPFGGKKQGSGWQREKAENEAGREVLKTCVSGMK